jgi:uncharacterized protein (DUF1015 family)
VPRPSSSCPTARIHAPGIYQREGQLLGARDNSLVLEDEPSVYFYRLRTDRHTQTGLAACFSLDEYDRGVIKKHERTRRDKEDDRTRHMVALRAQTGPVFLTYRANGDVDRIAAEVTATAPLFDFTAPDGVHHTLWRAGGADRDRLVSAFRGIPSLYIADGHHRAASAARARTELPASDEAKTMLAVAFPHDQVSILPYNRTVADLGGLTPVEFLEAIRERFEMEAGPAVPSRRGDMAMSLLGGTPCAPVSRLTLRIQSRRSMSACCRRACSRPC